MISADIEDHEIVIFDFSETISLDDSAAMVIGQLIDSAEEHGTPCIVAEMDRSVESALRSLEALNALPPERIVASAAEARELAYAMLHPQPAAEA